METNTTTSTNIIESKHKKGYFGIGIYGTKYPINIGTLWRSADAFNADYIFTIGKRYKATPSDTTKSWRHIPLFEFDTFQQFRDSLPKGSTLVGVKLAENSISLSDFKHPQRAVYLLGAEDFGLPQDVLTACNSIVQIPGKLCLNVSIAGSIVLYDRIMKPKHL